MKYIFTIFISMLCFFLTGFISRINYFDRSDQIVCPYVNQIKKKLGLFTYGSGGAMTDDIQEIGYAFGKYAHVDVETARKMYVEIAEGMINRVNSDPLIRPFLHNYPSTIRNVDLTLSFFERNMKKPPEGFICYVSVIRNQIYYRTNDSEKDRIRTIHKEPYEEAVRIVKEQQLREQACSQE